MIMRAKDNPAIAAKAMHILLNTREKPSILWITSSPGEEAPAPQDKWGAGAQGYSIIQAAISFSHI
jgi:hypothetical protein